jgi:iron complex transport system substrate-binding protein
MKFYLFALLMLATLDVEAEEPPKRIVSLSPRITENLYLLGVGERIVGNTIHCDLPPPARKKEKVGTLLRMNLEKVISLSPDIVFAIPLSNPEQVQKLKALGLRVIQFPTPKSFEELLEEFLKLGRIVGKEKRAEEIVRDVLRELRALREKLKGVPKKRVIIQVGKSPLYISPKDSFVSDVIEYAGGINVGPDGKRGRVGYEEVIKKNPDIIIIATMGLVGEEEKKIWEKFQEIEAVRQGRIYIIDSDILCSPTPMGFIEAVKILKDLLHPKI